LRGRIENDPQPRKNLPWWGRTSDEAPAKLKGVAPAGPADVATFIHDQTSEGVFDLAGNVHEWTSSALEAPGMRVIRGGAWGYTDLANLADFMAIENPRAPQFRDYAIGFRCASSP
jgi:iron(II)-dependent oxidoreductase